MKKKVIDITTGTCRPLVPKRVQLVKKNYLLYLYILIGQLILYAIGFYFVYKANKNIFIFLICMLFTLSFTIFQVYTYKAEYKELEKALGISDIVDF